MNLRFWRTRTPNTAADWFAQLHAGAVSRETDRRFQAWLARDARHEGDYERHELAWELSLELEDDAEIKKLICDAERTADAVAKPRTRHFAIPHWALATAASMLVAITAVLWWRAHLTESMLYSTGVGEQRTIVLPDQSQMTLNTDTQVRVSYTKALRSISLERGEATFTVTHDAAHPFEVSAAGGKTRALGTEFNVLKSDQGVTVVVLEGRVQVWPATDNASGNRPAPTTAAAIVSGGEEVTYAANQVSPVHAGQLRRVTAWHSRRIEFQDITLEQAVTEFNRYVQVHLVLGDPSLRGCRLSGVFRVGETQALLNALREAFGVTAESRNDVIILWPKGRPASMTVFNNDPA